MQRLAKRSRHADMYDPETMSDLSNEWAVATASDDEVAKGFTKAARRFTEAAVAPDLSEQLEIGADAMKLFEAGHRRGGEVARLLLKRRIAGGQRAVEAAGLPNLPLGPGFGCQARVMSITIIAASRIGSDRLLSVSAGPRPARLGGGRPCRSST